MKKSVRQNIFAISILFGLFILTLVFSALLTLLIRYQIYGATEDPSYAGKRIAKEALSFAIWSTAFFSSIVFFGAKHENKGSLILSLRYYSLGLLITYIYSFYLTEYLVHFLHHIEIGFFQIIGVEFLVYFFIFILTASLLTIRLKKSLSDDLSAK